jgi:hypothetical protein
MLDRSQILLLEPSEVILLYWRVLFINETETSRFNLRHKSTRWKCLGIRQEPSTGMGTSMQ